MHRVLCWLVMMMIAAAAGPALAGGIGFIKAETAVASVDEGNAKWKEILANYTEPELPADVERDLRKFLDEKK